MASKRARRGEGGDDAAAVAAASEDTGAAQSAVAADEAKADGSAAGEEEGEEAEAGAEASASEMVQTNKAEGQEKVGAMQKGVNGKIKINGEIYEAKCDCSKDALLKAKTKALAIESSKQCKVREN